MFPICYILVKIKRFCFDVLFNVHDNNFGLTRGKICNNIKTEQVFGFLVL